MLEKVKNFLLQNKGKLVAVACGVGAALVALNGC